MSRDSGGEEIGWWDHWNTKFRTPGSGFGPATEAARTGNMALDEIRALGLTHPAVLEVGCGTGWLAERLAGFGAYTGLDLSPAAIEVAKGRVPEAGFFSADFHFWDATSARYDVVVMVDTIAYFRDQDAAVGKAWALLRPGGWLVVTTVNPIVYSRISWVGAPGKGQVRKWLSRRALKALLTRNSFEVHKTYTLFPAGDKGFLRILNSRKLNRLIFRGECPQWLTRIKERAGLGQFRIAVAQRVEH